MKIDVLMQKPTDSAYDRYWRASLSGNTMTKNWGFFDRFDSSFNERGDMTLQGVSVETVTNTIAQKNQKGYVILNLSIKP